MRVAALIKGVELAPLGSVRERLTSRMMFMEAERENARTTCLVRALAVLVGLPKEKVTALQDALEDHRDWTFYKPYSEEWVSRTHKNQTKSDSDLIDFVNKLGG